MKSRIILCTVSLLITGWMLLSCNFVRSNKVAGSTMDSRNDNSVKAMDAYKAILQSNMVFFSTENKKNYKLKEFDYDNGSELDDPLQAHRYAYINLRGDDRPTLVVELSSGFDGAFEVLRYQEGAVYGFNFGYRALLDLTNDGTAYGSNGASDGRFYRLSIEKDRYKEEVLGYSKSNPDGSVSYFVGDKKVTSEAYDEFVSGMGKNKVVWQDFTDTDIASDSNPSPETLSTLLRNSGKIIPFSHVAESGGKVYASGFQCLPEWKPVAGVTHPTGGFAVIGDALIYYCHPGYTSPSPITLYRSDLQGNNVTEITDALDNFGNVWAAGDRVIYSTINDDDVRTGVFWYDVKTSKSTRLLKEMPYEVNFTLVSFSDEFVYYRLSNSSDLWRVRWDGAGRESTSIQFPDDVYKIEGDNYYRVSIDKGANTIAIYRISISNENNRASCVLEALPLRAIKDEWAYFFKGSTIYKVDVNSGKRVNLANMPSNMPESQLVEWFIVGNSLYIKARSYHQDNAFKVRLYKVPMNGGNMEYSDVEWMEYES